MATLPEQERKERILRESPYLRAFSKIAQRHQGYSTMRFLEDKRQEFEEELGKRYTSHWTDLTVGPLMAVCWDFGVFTPGIEPPKAWRYTQYLLLAGYELPKPEDANLLLNEITTNFAALDFVNGDVARDSNKRRLIRSILRSGCIIKEMHRPPDLPPSIADFISTLDL